MKKKILSLLLCLSVFASVFLPADFASAQTGDTAKITVNYVYEKNDAMVAQPYSAIVPAGQPFQATIALPKVLNYTITAESAAKLPEGIALDSESGLLNINLLNVTGDISMALYYRAGQAEYTVTSWKQKLGSEEYELIETVKLKGDIDAYTEAKAEQMEGFTSRVEQGIIAADGTTNVDIHYDRLSYTVVFDPNDGVNVSDPIYAEYGTTFDESYVKQPTRAGYIFKGWSPEIEYTITKSVTYVAQWEKESEIADYTIVIWGQNANDDEYAYLNSYPAYGQTDTEVTWNEGTLICPGSHVHNENCYELVCGKEEHSHVNEGCVLDCKHTHDLSCYGLDDNDKVNNKPNQINEPQGGFESGTVYTYTTVWGAITHYYLYLDGSWYCHHGFLQGDTTQITLNCTHNHSDACYSCGKEEHIHTDRALTGGCYKLTCTLEGHEHTGNCEMGALHPDRNLWAYERSDTITITADGQAVLNVYFTRKEFTITFRDGRDTVYEITERWGKDISDHWPIHGTNGTVYDQGERWKPSGSQIYNQVLVFIELMPAESFTLTVDRENYKTYVMHYYVEVLDGRGEREYDGKYFTEAFAVTANYNYVTEAEDFFALEGYTQWRSDPGFRNGQIEFERGGDVYFYYTRNSYNLNFFSGDNSNPVKTDSVKYEANLAPYDWRPTERPDYMEQDAKFVGWYLNPQCTGEKYDFAAHNMPPNDLALYAKWVNGLYTVRTFTDESLAIPYTYEGYTGKEENIVKYTLAQAPKDPVKDGTVFVGWFYKDGEAEKPFSFTMPITRDYDLYPKFSTEAVVPYTVHYYVEGTTQKLADDKTGEARIGSSVTEMAKMGSELNLVTDGQLYFPLQTSTSVKLNQANQEIIFYYKPAAETSYTVQYVDNDGNTLEPSVTKTTSASVVTEKYLEIPGYTPRQFEQTLNLSADPTKNVIVFVYDPSSTGLEIWKKGADTTRDPNASFVFHIKGTTGTNTSAVDLTVTIKGNSHIKITGLPVGSYTVEETDWSWRYTPDSASQSITLEAGGNNTLTFTNLRDNDQWLDGEDSCVNTFTGKHE